MKIYTRTGDAGQTGLFGGARVDKDDPRVEAYGTVDELNSCLGVVRALGAELACLPGKEDQLRMTMLGETDIARLEGWIDRGELPLEPLKNFVLPGGSKSAAELHLARTVCRRAERRTLSAGRNSPIRPEVAIYLNRLSDLLFVLARYEYHVAGLSDIPWRPR